MWLSDLFAKNSPNSVIFYSINAIHLCTDLNTVCFVLVIIVNEL